jgi:DNA-binding LacI/PurR family transcriptional regulator
MSEPLRGRKPAQSARVRERLLAMIADGQLRPGQALPTETALAAICGASQPTVNREIKRMLADGLLTSDRNGERIVAAPRGMLLRRTVMVCTSYADTDTSRLSRLDAWEINLELLTERYLVALGYMGWRVPSRRFSERELGMIASDAPCGAVMFTDGMDSRLIAAMRTAFIAAKVGLVVHGSPEEHADLDVVSSDHEAGGAMAAGWLATHGCQSLLFQLATPSDTKTPDWLCRRLAGIRRGAVEAGLPEPRPLYQPAGIQGSLGERYRFDREADLMAEAIRPHLGGPLPLGILTLSDGDVPRTWAAVRRLGLRPGIDVLLSGYDGYWADLLERQWEPTPPSVTVDKRHAEIGEQLASTLDWRLRDRAGAPARRVLVAPALRTAFE